MLDIIIFFSFLNLSFQQQEIQSSFILPKENQFLKGEFKNLDQKISQTHILGFGLWFKWQPEALQAISKIENECNEQFIFSLENSENKFIYILYLEIYQLQYQLKIQSDFFQFQEEIWFHDQFEGVWIFFDSINDYNKKITTFYLYKSLTQELTSYKIDQIPIIQNQIQYQIGKICDQCVIQNFVNCFTRFEGRLSILFQIDNFNESSNLSIIEQTYSSINDCVQKKQILIIGSQTFDKNFYSQINLGILEKLYFQLTGWVKIFDNVNNQEIFYFLITIYKNIKENYPNSEKPIQIIYQEYLAINHTAIMVLGQSDSRFSQNEQISSGDGRNFNFSMIKQWHFIQLDVGNPNQNGTLKIYSNQLEKLQSTGIYYGIEIGGDYFIGSKMNVIINNLEFKTFCQPLDQQFAIICHQTCLTCFGPFFDNCLSCKSSSRRFLHNDKCICEPDTIQFQEQETCQAITDIFNNLIIVEEELPCKQEGYDQCDDSVICSIGYFKYLESYCIKCPYFTTVQFDSQILCVNCLLDPDQFSKTLTCIIDAIQINQEQYSTFDQVQRNEENFECFELKQLNNKFYLQLIENKISNDPPRCRQGYFYENEECNRCGQSCIKCKSSIMCSKCEEGYYLDLYNVCVKCQNCLKCELKKDQQHCLQCPQKYYLENQQCFQCGQFCADCKSNRYCNYCIDPQKYFISIDGINCLICNIQNCKYCYQLYKIENQIFYTSFNLDLENQIQKKQSMDNTIYCARCQEGYYLDLNTNVCIKPFNLDYFCLFGLYDEAKSEFECFSDIIVNPECQYRIKNCNRCFSDKCIECEKGYYVDFLAYRCSKCPLQCENCIFQNKKLMDNWKIEILPRYDKIYYQQKFDILSKIKDDYEIECTSCPLKYILYNSNCIFGCDDECLKCEIIRGSARCVECKRYNNKIVRSIDQNGQCLRCSKNCELCGERSKQSLQKINKFFIQNQENKIFTSSCYQLLPSKNDKTSFVSQVIDCEKYNKCKRKAIFSWNIYCDIQQFQNIQNKEGLFQEGNYYFNDFFEREILSKLEIINQFLNEKIIEKIDIIVNIFQGNSNSCKPSKQQENLIKIHSTFIYNVFVSSGVNLKVSGQKQNVLLEELIFDISGFQQISFENLSFLKNQISITDTLMNSLSFINCSFENNSPIQTLIPYNLNLINNGFFQFYFGTGDLEMPNVSLIIDGLRIINSKLQNSKFISIITDIGPKVACYINNLEIIETELNSSFLLTSLTLSGQKNMFFGNLTLTNLKIENVSLKNSILLYIPNVLQFNINFLTVKNLKLQSNSYLILSNQLYCQNIHLNRVDIDKSYLFSNKVPLLYQTVFGDSINVYLNNFIIENVFYNQEQFLLQIIRFNNFKLIVNFHSLKIDQISQLDFQQNFLSQDISSIYIQCTECFLNQIEIYRSYGIPELSIMDSQFITISNSFFTQNKQYAKDLFNGCQTNVINTQPKFIYIGQYDKIKIYNLTIYDAIGYNFPFIMLKGIDIMQKQIYENIEIFNSRFENNKLITTESNSPTSIIKIQTEQKSFINLTNLTFSYNHLNMEIQDLITKSLATFIIDAQLGIILINYCLFQQNIVTNSSDSTLNLKAQSIEISNSRFIKNNVLNYQNLFNRVKFKNLENSSNDQYLKQLIKVQSNGGSGYLLTNALSLKNCSIFESYSLYGGAFFVYTFGDAQIVIEDSIFVKTSSSLESSVQSNGGCFYIDAQVSKLTLLVRNSTFNQSYGRSKGGCFYILPSNSYNFVYFEQINVTNSFSTASQFFEFSLQNLNNIISNVTFYNIQIIYDKIEFYQFLSLLDGLSNIEAQTIINNAPIIMVKYGNVTIDNIYCQLEIKNFLAQIDQGQIIKCNKIYIENGFIRNSPLFSFNLESGFSGLLTIQNIKINNLLEYQEINDSSICQVNKIKNTFEQFCITPVIVNQNITLENKIETIQLMTLCKNKNLLLKSEKLDFSLIVISNIETNHNIIIQEMFLSDIMCKNCQNGLLSFTNIDEYNKNNIILNGIMIQKSQCGIQGCLSIINKKSNNFLKTNYITNEEGRILEEQNYESLKFTLNFQVSLSNSKFIQNRADYGGAVFAVDIDILINLCYFQKNKAKVGGAIYSFTSLRQKFRTIIFASILTDNQAELAANIYLENQMFQQTEKLNLIIENNSTIKGSNVVEKPRSLAISTNNSSIVLQKEILKSTSSQIIEQTIIKPYKFIGFKENIETLMFPSGQTIKDYYYFDIFTSTNIPYNLSFRIIALNMLNQKEDQLNGSICTLKHKVINKTNQHEIEDFYAKLSSNKITFNTSTLDFNLDELIVYFNPYYEKEIIFRLYIQCEMIQIPVYDEKPPFLITNFITDYQLLVDIKTFPCQLGEYFNSTSKICIRCNSDQSQYQVQQNATICSIKDETRIKSVESEKIELKPNFWRAYFYSTKIEECYHLLENCLGGWYPGDKSCAFGHIGALCEQCDLYNIRGDGHFSTSSPYQCSNCDQIEGNIITIFLISLWTLLSVQLSVNSTIDTINQFIVKSKLKLILFGISSLSKQSSAAVFIKIFTNYLQIISTVSTFQLKVPAGFTQIFTSVGNPIEQVAYSLDCFLITIKLSGVSQWQFRMQQLFFYFQPLQNYKINQIQYINDYNSTHIFVYFFTTKYNLAIDITRLIQNTFQYSLDLRKCYLSIQFNFSLILVGDISIPILISLSLLIPLFMFYRIHSKRHHLEQIKIREAWGYLYNEYKLQAYYWEFVKIFQKELIIIFLAYYEDFIAIKASLVFLVIFTYSLSSNSVQSYMTGELNRIDTQSTTVSAISIILGSSIYTAQNQNFIEIVYPFYVIIALINGWFLFKMIIHIFLAYFDKFYEQIDKVKEIISLKFPKYLLKHPQAKKFLESKKSKLGRIQSRFAMIKQYLIPQAKKILKFKNEIQFERNSNSSFSKVDDIILSNDMIIK